MKAVLLENHPLLRAGLAQMLAHPALGLDVSAPECQDWSQEAPQLADLLVIGVDEAFGTLATQERCGAIKVAFDFR